MSGADVRVKVWDPWVRLGHWLLVIGFFLAYLTAEDPLAVHVWGGYGVAAIVALRIIWGFVGPPHARFTSFSYSPRRVVAYLGGLFTRRAPRYLGHSPAVGAMVILLLAMLAAVSWSGFMVYAYDQGGGPLGSWVAEHRPTESAAFEAREEYWEETHELVVNLTLLLVFLHVGGVLLASFVHRENLVVAMFTGYKRDADKEE